MFQQDLDKNLAKKFNKCEKVREIKAEQFSLQFNEIFEKKKYIEILI